MAYPTDQEFEHQRREIRETFPRLFEAVEGQLKYVDEHLTDVLAAKSKKTKYDLALLAHLARASKTALGIVRECEHGFGELAMSSLRTLGETMVSAYWMSLDSDARADKFEGWAKIEALDTLRFIEAMGWREEVEEIPDDLENDEWVAAVKKEYPNRVLGWMQVPMKQVVKDISPCWRQDKGKRLREMLEVARLFGDRHSHVGAFDTVKYLRATDDGELTIHLGPGKRWVPQALVVTAWMYGQVFDLAAEDFGLSDIEEWRKEWRLLAARCVVVTREQAKNVGRNDPCPCGSSFKFKRCHLELVASR